MKKLTHNGTLRPEHEAEAYQAREAILAQVPAIKEQIEQSAPDGEAKQKALAAIAKVADNTDARWWSNQTAAIGDEQVAKSILIRAMKEGA